jgi:hypothetical protein
VPIQAGRSFYASIYTTSSLAKPWTFRVCSYDKDVVETFRVESTGTTTAGGGWVRAAAGTTGATPTSVTADMRITFTSLARNELVYLDSAMLEIGVGAPGVYFDGGTAATPTTTNHWADPNAPHRTPSVQTLTAIPSALPPAEAPTTKTLIASGGARQRTRTPSSTRSRTSPSRQPQIPESPAGPGTGSGKLPAPPVNRPAWPPT